MSDNQNDEMDSNSTLTRRQLNRASLARQMLLERHSIGVVEAVRRVVGLQAQEPASPYMALWNRIADFDPADLDNAFAKSEIVKATLIRITLHAVGAEDYTTFHEVMLSNLRASRLYERRYTSTGLTVEDADSVVPELLEFASEPRSRPEIEDMLEMLFEARPDGRLWWALRTFAPLIHSWRCWPTMTRTSTADSADGGIGCLRRKSGSCPAETPTSDAPGR